MTMKGTRRNERINVVVKREDDEEQDETLKANEGIIIITHKTGGFSLEKSKTKTWIGNL